MRLRNYTFLLLFLCLSFTQISAQTARVQVIHNSPDAAAETVDVWLDNTLLLDDFAFRTASPFVDAPAGVDIEVRIQPPTSMDTANPIGLFKYNLMAGETYIIAANGIVSASGYSPAPAFDLDVHAGAKEAADMGTNTDVLVLHGSTDAPTVDVYETTAGMLIDDLMYKSFAGYLALATADYSLEVRDMTGATTVATYSAPLSTLSLDGAAITVIASGFLDPTMNSNGAGFGLYVALASGGALVELPVATGIIEENSGVNNLTAYPNPATSLMTLDLELEQNTTATVQVMDLMGSIVMNQEAGLLNAGNNRIELDINTLPAGTYLYRVTTDSGMAAGKFVKMN